jgi:hypothetical protein
MCSRIVFAHHLILCWGLARAAFLQNNDSDSSAHSVDIQRMVYERGATCSGKSPLQASICYTGQQMGEHIIVHVKEFDATSNDGTISVYGSGMSPIDCQKSFSQKGLDIETDISDCLPALVETTGMKFCSDQNMMLFEATVFGRPHRMRLFPSDCPSMFLEKGSRNDLYSHSAWIWDSPCSGIKDPPSTAPFCYTGSKMGEIVSIRVDKFDKTNQLGSVLVTGSGLTPVKCKRTFSKADQQIMVEELAQCLPKTVKPHGLRYCSDQNVILMDADVGPLTVELSLIPTPCPAFLLEGARVGSSLLEDARTEWMWDSAECTGSANPPTQSPFCYSGSKLGETVTIKVSKYDSLSNAGSVLISASGLTHLACQRDFKKTSQMVNIDRITECLPKNIKAEGVKFCSDQNHVVLDAHVGPLPVQMVLTAGPCTEALLEKHPDNVILDIQEHISGQVLPSGMVRRMVRSQPAAH